MTNNDMQDESNNEIENVMNNDENEVEKVDDVQDEMKNTKVEVEKVEVDDMKDDVVIDMKDEMQIAMNKSMNNEMKQIDMNNEMNNDMNNEMKRSDMISDVMKCIECNMQHGIGNACNMQHGIGNECNMQNTIGNEKVFDILKPSINRMKDRYDLNAGKVSCKCILRKWKFCKKIKDLAEGKVTRKLLEINPIPPGDKTRQNPNLTKNENLEKEQRPKIPILTKPDLTKNENCPIVQQPEDHFSIIEDTKCPPKVEKTPIHNRVKRKRGRPPRGSEIRPEISAKTLLDRRKYWIGQGFRFDSSESRNDFTKRDQAYRKPYPRPQVDLKNENYAKGKC